MDYSVYMLEVENFTYIGITNNLAKRLILHNSGNGAKATKKFTNWKYKIVARGFNKSSASKFEWYWKHCQTKNGWRRTSAGIINKLKRLTELTSQEEWEDVIIEIYS